MVSWCSHRARLHLVCNEKWEVEKCKMEIVVQNWCKTVWGGIKNFQNCISCCHGHVHVNEDFNHCTCIACDEFFRRTLQAECTWQWILNTYIHWGENVHPTWCTLLRGPGLFSVVRDVIGLTSCFGSIIDKMPTYSSVYMAIRLLCCTWSHFTSTSFRFSDSVVSLVMSSSSLLHSLAHQPSHAHTATHTRTHTCTHTFIRMSTLYCLLHHQWQLVAHAYVHFLQTPLSGMRIVSLPQLCLS